MERRTVLTMLVHSGTAAVGLVVGVPVAFYTLAPRTVPGGEARWTPVGPLADFAIGAVCSAAVPPVPHSDALPALRRGVYVWRIAAEEVIVFSRSCTDLGCPVTFDPGSECYLCPCHGGIFSKQGDPIAGPPDRPLYQYLTKIEGGILYINLASVPPMA